MSAKEVYDELTRAGLSMWVNQNGQLGYSCGGQECSAQIDATFERARSNAPALVKYIREHMQNLVRAPMEQPAPRLAQTQSKAEAATCGCHRTPSPAAPAPAEDATPHFMHAAYRGV